MFTDNLLTNLLLRAVPVTTRSKAVVCGRSLARIASLNPSGNMDVCLLCFFVIG